MLKFNSYSRNFREPFQETLRQDARDSKGETIVVAIFETWWYTIEGYTIYNAI